MTTATASEPWGLRRTIFTGVLVGMAAVFLVALISATGSERLGYDFRAGYLPAAEAVVDGISPYMSHDPSAGDAPLPYVYPPQLALALVPFTLLSADAAAFVAFLGCFVALGGALAIVGVRDVRCYAAILLWAPGWNALEMANVSALLALALALMWRWRATKWELGIALGLAVSVKLFLWPMLVWTVAMRRLRPVVVAVAAGIGLTVAAWAAIGFEGLRSYPDQLGEIEFDSSYSIVGMTLDLGLGRAVGDVLSAIVGVALLGLVVRFARREDELGAFTCAIAAALVLSPVVWQHYLVLLAIPLALYRPRFSVIWLLPVILWLSPRAGNGEAPELFLPALVAVVLLVVSIGSRRTESVLSKATM